MTITEIILSNYEDTSNTLAREFCNHMGFDFDDGYWIGSNLGFDTFDIADTFWDSSNMFITLKYNIPSDLVFKWFRERVEKDLKTNLYHYYLQGKQSQYPDYKTLENQH